MTGIDLVVDNVVAAKIILGEGKPPSQINADEIKVTMTRNGEVVNEGQSTMVEGSPWNSLLWLVRTLAKKNMTLKAGHVIMTGGIAKFLDSVPGDYSAISTGLGTITFRVTA